MTTSRGLYQFQAAWLACVTSSLRSQGEVVCCHLKASVDPAQTLFQLLCCYTCHFTSYAVGHKSGEQWNGEIMGSTWKPLISQRREFRTNERCRVKNTKSVISVGSTKSLWLPGSGSTEFLAGSFSTRPILEMSPLKNLALKIKDDNNLHHARKLNHEHKKTVLYLSIWWIQRHPLETWRRHEHITCWLFVVEVDSVQIPCMPQHRSFELHHHSKDHRMWASTWLREAGYNSMDQWALLECFFFSVQMDETLLNIRDSDTGSMEDSMLPCSIFDCQGLQVQRPLWWQHLLCLQGRGGLRMD